MILSGLAAVAALGLAGVQADDGWDVMSDPTRHLVAAGVQFDGGVSLAVQCEAGQLMLVLGGVPEADDAIRRFDAVRADGASQATYWTLPSGSQVLTSRDVRTIRFIRTGGRLTLASGPGEPRPTRVEMNLPTNPAGLDQVLGACGRPLSDPRDALEALGDLMLESPRLEIFGDLSRVRNVRVEISCVVKAGKLADCQSDNETPTAPEIGRETARHANGYRMKLSDPVAAEGRVLDVVVTGSRIVRMPS
jgi:hypothetical protein